MDNKNTDGLSEDENQWSETPPFLNYNHKEKGGLLNDEWARSKDELFYIDLYITNNTPFHLSNLMFVHSNIKKHTHLQRALYQKRFAKRCHIQLWPVFKSGQPWSLCDGFQLQFCIESKENKIKEQYINQYKLEGTLLEEIDKKVEVEICFEQSNLQVKIFYESYQKRINQNTYENIWIKKEVPEQRNREVEPELKIEEKAAETETEIETKIDEESERAKDCLKVDLVPKNTKYFENLMANIDIKNKETIEQLTTLFKLNPPFYNEYSFLASYFLKDQQLYEVNQQMLKEHQTALEIQFRKLSPQNLPATTLDEIRHRYQRKFQQEGEEKSRSTFLKCIYCFCQCFIKQKMKKKESEACFQQSELGNCYFISAMDQIITKASFILDKIWVFQDKKHKNAVSILNVDGKMSCVEVDFNLFKEKDEDFLKYSHFGGFFHIVEERRYKNIGRCILLQKCLATIFGNYPNLSRGSPREIFMILTNHNTQIFNLYGSSPNSFGQIQKYHTIEIMRKWNSEWQDIKKKPVQLNTQPRQFFNSRVHIDNPNHLPIYTFIVIYSFDKASLLKQLPFTQGQAGHYDQHGYSFQGVYPDEPFSLNTKFYVKLRDLRDESAARIWRFLWQAQHLNDIKREVNGAFTIYSSHKVKIECDYNQFIVELDQLVALKARMGVCSYDPEAYFNSMPVIMRQSESSNFQISMKRTSVSSIVLHQQNIRRKNQIKSQKKDGNIEKDKEKMMTVPQKQNITKQSSKKDPYNKITFELGLQDKKKMPFLQHRPHHMIATFTQELLAQNNVKYLLRVSMAQRYEYEMCYISILSKSRLNYLQEDYSNQPTSPINYTRTVTGKFILNKSIQQNSHIFQNTSTRYAMLYCRFMGDKGDLTDIQDRVKLSSHSISDLTISTVLAKPIYDDFLYSECKQEEFEQRFRLVKEKLGIEQSQKVHKLSAHRQGYKYGVFNSQNMQKDWNMESFGDSVFRVAFDGFNNKSGAPVCLDYFIEFKEINLHPDENHLQSSNKHKGISWAPGKQTTSSQKFENTFPDDS